MCGASLYVGDCSFDVVLLRTLTKPQSPNMGHDSFLFSL